MPTRSARVAWNGTLAEGSGQVELSSSGLGTFDVSWPRRTSDADSKDGTTPEELIAAAHASCFSMALSGQIAKAGGTPHALNVSADVSFGPDEERGGFQITGIKLTVEGEVEGMDEAAFKEAADGAKSGCPVSKALAGTTIEVAASLA
jgi:osmotically inducible protein OsmC